MAKQRKHQNTIFPVRGITDHGNSLNKSPIIWKKNSCNDLTMPLQHVPYKWRPDQFNPTRLITARYNHHSHGHYVASSSVALNGCPLPQFDNSARTTSVLLGHCLTQISCLVILTVLFITLSSRCYFTASSMVVWDENHYSDAFAGNIILHAT